MAVDLQAHGLRGVAEFVEQGRVRLGRRAPRTCACTRASRWRTAPRARCRPRACATRDRSWREPVRQARHRARASPSAALKQPWMIGHPLQRSVGEDDVERCVRLPGQLMSPCTNVNPGTSRVRARSSIASDESTPIVTAAPSCAVQRCGEQSGAAAEVDDATGRASGDQCHEVMERLLTLDCESARTGPGSRYRDRSRRAGRDREPRATSADRIALPRCAPDCGRGSRSARRSPS